MKKTLSAALCTTAAIGMTVLSPAAAQVQGRAAVNVSASANAYAGSSRGYARDPYYDDRYRDDYYYDDRDSYYGDGYHGDRYYDDRRRDSYYRDDRGNYYHGGYRGDVRKRNNDNTGAWIAAAVGGTAVVLALADDDDDHPHHRNRYRGKSRHYNKSHYHYHGRQRCYRRH